MSDPQPVPGPQGGQRYPAHDVAKFVVKDNDETGNAQSDVSARVQVSTGACWNFLCQLFRILNPVFTC